MPKNTARMTFALPLRILFSILIGAASIVHASDSATLSDGETLSLIGVGVHQELRNDIYLGALYGPASVTKVEDLKSDNVAKRMSLRFVSDYSNRKLTRHWKERMAMNNPRTQWQPLTREIVGFSKLFKRSLVAGDEINIDHIPGKGTEIYLNGTLFQTFTANAFNQILLNVWIGNIPPTKAFGSSIRGQDKSSVKESNIARYASIESVKGRFDNDLQASKPLVVAKAKPAVKKKVISKKPATPVKKKLVAKVTPKKVVKETPINKPANTSTAATESKKLVDAVANAPALTAAEPPKPTDITTESSNGNSDKEAQVELEVAEAEPIEENFFDADLLAGSYTRDLINAIRQHQVYPREALLEKREGDVTAKVTIDDEGDIVDVTLIERSGSRVLDKAASRIIKKAAPFQAIPVELNQKEFVFEVPVSFQL